MLWIAFTITLAAVMVVACAFVVAYVPTHPPRLRIHETPAQFGAAFEDVSFVSVDGTRLDGWWIPAEVPCAVLILCHGMVANREQMLRWAEWLWKAGYSMLLFDFRAMGTSDGDLCTMGLREAYDVIGAVDHVAQRLDARGLPIGGVGFSMGGSALMMAAAREPRLKAISTLGSYATLHGAITQRCRRHFGPLGPLVEKPARTLGARWFPGDPGEVDCLRAVASLNGCAALFVTGKKDPIVLHSNSRDLYTAASEPKDLLLLPDTVHEYPRGEDLKIYKDRVLEFFSSTLSTSSTSTR